MQLPVSLISALCQRVKNSEPLLQQYYDKIKEITVRQREMGIALNTTNQTSAQTEELLKEFSGQGCLSFPQWKHESFAVLQSSGISKAHWYNILLKKIVAPAITKISQESISSKEVDRILTDLRRHYNKSLVIAAAITSVHISAGKIPDPEFDIARSLPILTAHHEALVATEEFLKRSDLPDKEDAVFQSSPVNDLILLMPDRVRINHQDKTFQDSSCTSGAAKTRHQAFSTWVRETRSKLLIWDVETQATTKVHQAMVGTLVEPAATTPQLSASAEAKIQQISNQVQTLGSHVSILLARPAPPPIHQSQTNVPRNNGHAPHPNQAESPAAKLKNCRYCILLSHNTNWASTSIATATTTLTNQDFNHTHYQFTTRDQTKYILPPNGCLQWILAPMETRIQAVSTTPSVCSVCLSVPQAWNDTKTQCKVTHGIKRRRDGRANAVCMKEGCHYNFLVCKEHKELNKNHPFGLKATSWIQDRNRAFPVLAEAGTPGEFALLTSSSAMPTYNTTTFTDAAKIAFAAIAYTVKALSKRKPEIEPIGATTIFPVCQQQLSSSSPQLPQAVVSGLSEASVLINNRLWKESELPDCVTLDRNKFLKNNAPAHPSDLVDRTQGQAVYLYIDLYGNNGKSIRTVFDSGATISLWLNQIVLEGLLETRIDSASPAAISGIGQNTTQAITCTIILPGNKRNPITGNYVSFVCKSTMVQQIIPPLPQTDQTQLIEETIQAMKQHTHSIPEDMIPSNFQSEIGGQLQGLIGAKHLQEFPVAVMHLRNGLSIYRHSLRPAGSRSKVYCIGGSLPAVTAFKQAYGNNIHDFANLMMYENMVDGDYSSALATLFDGDVYDPNLRNKLPALTDGSYRDQQGEDDCRTLQESALASSLATNSASKHQLDFHAPASTKTPH